MMKYRRLKQLWGQYRKKLAILGILASLVITAIIATHLYFSKTYVNYLIDQWNAQSGFTLTHNNQMDINWFPSPNVNLFDAKIRGDEQRLYAERINIRLPYSALWGNREIAKVTLIGPKWYGRMGKKSISLPARMVIREGEFHQKNYHLHHINGEYRKIGDALDLDMTADFQRDTLTSKIALTGLLSYQSDNYRLNGVKLVTQHATHWGELQSHWTADQIVWQNGQLNTSAVYMKGQLDNSTINLQSDPIEFDHEHHRLNIARLQAAFHQVGDETWNAQIELADFAHQQGQWRSSNAQFSLTHKTPQVVRILRMRSPLTLDSINNWSLPALTLSTLQTHANGSHPLWQSNFSGNVIMMPDTLDATLSGEFEHNAAQIELHRQNEQCVQVSAHVQKLIPALYWEGFQNLKSAQNVYQSFDKIKKSLVFKRFLPLCITADIGQINIGSGAATEVNLSANFNDKHVKVDIQKAKLYGGAWVGSFVLENQGAQNIHIEHRLNHIDMKQWLGDWMNLDRIEGKGDIQMDLSLSALRLDDWRGAINGHTAVRVQHGKLYGIDFASIVPHQAQSVSHTLFDTLNFITDWEEGVGKSRTILLEKSPLQVQGSGSFNLKTQSLDYLLDLKQPDRRLPLKITGTASAPEYWIDYDSIANHVRYDRKQAVDDILQQWKPTHP